MGSFKTLFISSICLSSAVFANLEEQKIQFLIAKKEYTTAINNYLTQLETTKEHNQDILSILAKSIIENAISSSDSKSQMLGLYGLLVSETHDPQMDYSKLVQSSDPYVQLITIQHLSQLHEDSIELILNRAMSSNFLPVRMQALSILVAQKSKLALSHIESLFYRLPPAFKPYFADYYAALGTPHSLKILNQLLSDPNQEVRIAALLAILHTHRDDFIPGIKKLLTQPDPQLQETAIHVLSKLKDQSSLSAFQGFLQSNSVNLKLAAAAACLEFDDLSGEKEIITLAKEGNPFAIMLLPKLENGKKTLLECAKNPNLDIRLNCLAALLELKHPFAKTLLKEFLAHFTSNEAICPIFSTGKTQLAFKITPSYRKQFAKHAEYIDWMQGTTFMIRQQFLIQAVELPESDFIEIAEVIFENDQFDLVPTLIKLLENCKSDAAVNLLKKLYNKPGSPRVRCYAMIALARMNIPEYQTAFLDWIKTQKVIELIRFRTHDTKDSLPKSTSRYHMTPDENSELLLEAFATLIMIHDERTLPIFLNAIAGGHPQNAPVLSGLLLKAIQ